MNKINTFHLKDINTVLKVEKRRIDWKDIKNNLGTFHQEVTEIILNPEALYFYATNNHDSIFMPQKLSAEQEALIKNIFDILIKNPSEFYNNYKKEERLLSELETLSTKEEIQSFLGKYGYKHTFKSEDNMEKEKTNIRRKIKDESSYGIFGEIIFYTVVEYLMDRRNLLLSKISFITAPGTYSHGCDGIFCDYEQKTLYFGESKFTIDLSSGMEQALNSLNDLTIRLKNDKNFIMCHTRDFKNTSSVTIINSSNISEYKLKILIFSLHGEEFNDDDLVNCISRFDTRLKNTFKKVSYEIISFPILDKESLKSEIAKQVSSYD